MGDHLLGVVWPPASAAPVESRPNSDRIAVVVRSSRSAARGDEMEFRVLGPLEVRDQGRPLPLGGGKQRSLLGVLLLHANETVSSERLVDELWGARPPARAHKLVQGYVSGLRKLLGPGRLVTRPPGYLVRLDAGELDALEFDRLVGEARAGREPQQVAE